jgi:hypothetical protein
MPCRDYDPSPIEYREGSETKKKLDKVTALLCGLCRKLEGYELFTHILNNNKELNTWWIDHQEKDRKEAIRLAKIKREKILKKNALAKLTPDERKLLNL